MESRSCLTILCFSVLFEGLALSECPQEPIHLRSLGRLVATSFAKNSPRGHATRLAELTHDSASRVLDPQINVQTQWSQLKEGGPTTSLGVNQSFSWGTSAGVSLASPENQGNSWESLRDEGRLAVTLGQDLLGGGPWWGNVEGRAANLHFAIEMVDAESALQEAQLTAVKAYLSLHTALRRQEVVRQQRESSEGDLLLVQDLISRGFKAPAEQYAVEARLLRARLAEASEGAAAQSREGDLRAALFVADTCALRLGDDGEYLPLMESRFASISSRDNSFVMKKVELERDLSDTRVDSAVKKSLPHLRLGLEGERDLAASAPMNWGASLVLSFSPTSSIAGSDREQARLQRESSQRTMVQVNSRHRETLEAAGREVLLAKSRHEATQRLLELQQKTLAAERQRYQDGQATIFDVQRAADAVDSAELEVLESRRALFLSLLEGAGVLGDTLASQTTGHFAAGVLVGACCKTDRAGGEASQIGRRCCGF